MIEEIIGTNNIPSFPETPIGLTLMEYLTPICSKIVKKDLIPAYVFGRCYTNKNILKRHKDLHGSEYGITISIDYDKLWPFCLEDFSGKEHKIVLKRGDAIIYKACELSHWREEYKGNKCFQFFLFWSNNNKIKFGG